jgi:tRNA pseudouridine55 synthase
MGRRHVQLPHGIVATLERLNGILGVKKPSGESSAATLERLKKRLLELIIQADANTSLSSTEGKVKGSRPYWQSELGKRLKVGHGGTLDPMASGVLVVGIGSGCKKMHEYLKDTIKCYRATGRFGQAYDTLDCTGKLLSDQIIPYEHIDEETLRRALREKFTGKIKQRPPMFSAIHINGQRAYDLARRQQNQPGNDAPAIISPEMMPEREVIISKLELLSYHPPEFTIEMDCSSGTYVRSLISDVGEYIGSAAAMFALERTQQGPIRLQDCVDVEDLTDLPVLVKSFQVIEK